MNHIAFRSETRPFAGAIDGAVYNPCAHGNVTYVVHCASGAERRRNVNGLHEEVGEWDLLHERQNVQAVTVTVRDCQRYLEIAGGSRRGREILTELLGPDGAKAIIDAPYRGDVNSTLEVARLVHARLR